MSSHRSRLQYHRIIFHWYSRHRRAFPWRVTANPYRILLSEIMAQQTQIGRVEVFYRKWLRMFPSFNALARASSADVLRAWSGLGYNSRALRFHSLAKIVSKEYRSRLPNEIDRLMELPGIGRYTAHAVACFAFAQPVPLADINIKRIITRWTKKIASSSELLDEQTAWDIAGTLLPKKNVFDWNQALMDFGAQICTARMPACSQCPVSHLCASAHAPAFRKPAQHSQKIEPSWKGVPRRLYRGKIVKMLHRRSMSSDEIAFALWPQATLRDRRWVRSVSDALTREGLLSLRGKKFRLAS